jgi:hypothetical protein
MQRGGGEMRGRTSNCPTEPTRERENQRTTTAIIKQQIERIQIINLCCK